MFCRGVFFQILLRRSSGRDSRLGSWKDSERRRERKGPQPWPKRLSDSSITPHISILRPSVSVTFDEWGPDSAFPKHVTPLYPGAGETHIRWCLHENLCFLLVCKWGRAELEQGHDHVTYCQRSHVADCHHFIISSSGDHHSGSIRFPARISRIQVSEKVSFYRSRGADYS